MNLVVQPQARAWAWQGATIYCLDTFPWRSLWHDPGMSKPSASFTGRAPKLLSLDRGNHGGHPPTQSRWFSSPPLLQVGSVICQDHCKQGHQSCYHTELLAQTPICLVYLQEFECKVLGWSPRAPKPSVI